MENDIRTVTLADLADGAAQTPLLGPAGESVDPVLIVDLDDVAPAVVSAAAARLPEGDRLLIGRCRGPLPDAVAPLLTALDLTYTPCRAVGHRAVVGADDPGAALSVFSEAVRAFPQAALVAGQVVRISERLPIAQAIDVESLAYSTLQGGAEFGRWLDRRRALGRALPPVPVHDPVLLAREGDTLHITLNRPERRNAYGTAIRDALTEALRVALADNGIRTVVLDGAGSSFCAGGDLDEFGHAPDTATAHLIRTRAGAGRLVAELADRMEVRLHGHCVGAGIEIPAFAARVVAAPDTVLRFPEVEMGLIPGAGGTVSVVRRIGRWRALHLFVTGEAVSAQHALDWGLIDEISP